jgi:hypothetical protein
MLTQRKRPALALCILLDAIGCLSYFIPALGELSDVVWAPVSTVIFYLIFGGKVGILGGIFDFLEEIFPFTDIIPTFTIAWIYRKVTDRTKGQGL